VQRFPIDQSIVHHDSDASQALGAFCHNEAEIARSGANQEHTPLRLCARLLTSYGYVLFLPKPFGRSNLIAGANDSSKWTRSRKHNLLNALGPVTNFLHPADAPPSILALSADSVPNTNNASVL
jgi:hypothetical protein